MKQTSIKEVIAVLEHLKVPRYSMAIPNQKREVIGYSVTFGRDGFMVKLKGNQSTKKYQKLLIQWGEIVRDALILEFDVQVTYHHLNEFLVKEMSQ